MPHVISFPSRPSLPQSTLLKLPIRLSQGASISMHYCSIASCFLKIVVSLMFLSPPHLFLPLHSGHCGNPVEHSLQCSGEAMKFVEVYAFEDRDDELHEIDLIFSSSITLCLYLSLRDSSIRAFTSWDSCHYSCYLWQTSLAFRAIALELNLAQSCLYPWRQLLSANIQTIQHTLRQLFPPLYLNADVKIPCAALYDAWGLQPACEVILMAQDTPASSLSCASVLPVRS